MLGAPRQGRDSEHRFPAALGDCRGCALYAALPSNLTLGSRFVVPGLELVLLFPVLAFNPRRLTRQTTWSRSLSLALVGVIGLANLVSLVLLVRALVQGGDNDSHKLLAGRASDLAHQHHRFRPRLLGTRPRWTGPTGHPRLGPSFPRPTSGSPRTRTPTPSPKWPPRRRIAWTGRPSSSTTSMYRLPTVRRSVPPTRCPCPAGPSCSWASKPVPPSSSPYSSSPEPSAGSNNLPLAVWRRSANSVLNWGPRLLR